MVSADAAKSALRRTGLLLTPVSGPVRPPDDSTVGGTQKAAYGYDEASRLTSASYWDGTNQTYTYDAAGNRSSLVSGATTTYSFDAAGRLKAAGGTTYGYDNDGNRTAATTGGVTTSYSYDQADRLIGVSGGATGAGTTYTYNGNGMRTAATNASTHATTSYQWDPLSGALLGDGSNEYVDSASGGLMVQTPTAGGASAALFGVPDASGSTRVLTNGSAQTQGTAAYDAFGVPKSSGTSGSATSPLGYAGQLTDSQTGFQYLRARTYDPSTGQFTSQDTYAGDSGQPNSLNRYTYGSDNPTTFTDPSGHWSIGGCLGPVCGSIGSNGASISIYDGNGYQIWSASVLGPNRTGSSDSVLLPHASRCARVSIQPDLRTRCSVEA